MILSIFLLIIIALITIIYIGNKSENKTQQQIEEFKKTNNIPTSSQYVTLEEINNKKMYIKTPYGDKVGMTKILYKDEENLYISDNCKDVSKEEERKRVVSKHIIPLTDIVCYELNGEYTINNIIEGGGISVGGAIVGGVLAGGVGAILAGRKKITTTQQTIDNRVVYLYYKEKDNINRLAFNKRNIDIFKNMFPNKNIEIIKKNIELENL